MSVHVTTHVCVRACVRDASVSDKCLRCCVQEDDIDIDDESSTCLARDTLLREGGAQLLARVIEYKQVGGKLKIHHLSAAGLPKSDMLGESDPYLRVFLGDKEVRTEIIMDTSKPAWKKVVEFEVEDVAEACLYIMCYDWEEYGDHQFIAMTVIHLADVVADALENGQMVRRAVTCSLHGSFLSLD